MSLVFAVHSTPIENAHLTQKRKATEQIKFDSKVAEFMKENTAV